ncbi:MAG: TonB-dependent receptor plug domain-containing protein [Flavobacteriaceae bacterium]
MNKLLISLCANGLVCLASTAQQQNDTLQPTILDEVVVSDSRFALKREHSGKTVIKISQEELENHQGQNVAEIINLKSGIEINGSRGREGAILGVFARGGRGRQVLVVIDGIRVSDPASSSSEYDLRLLSTANIESIEIMKGASSTLYGANAATAVINVVTKKAPKARAQLNLSTSWGTNQTSEDQNNKISEANNNVCFGGTLGRFTYQTVFTNRYADGLSAVITPENQADAFSTYGTDFKIGYHSREGMNVFVYGNATHLKTDYDDAFGFTDAPFLYKSTQKRVGLQSAFPISKTSLNFNIAFTDYRSGNISDFPNIFNGRNVVADLYHKYNMGGVLYSIIGLNYIKDTAQFDATEDITILDPYVNMVLISSLGLNLNMGLRWNNHSEYGSHLVYNFNPSYTLETKRGYLKFLGSWATSYVTPSLTQLYGFFGANPDLEPENDKTLETAIELANNNFRISTLYFNRREENFVFYDGQNAIYRNAIEQIMAQGFEVELNWEIMEKIQLMYNYTFTERKGDAGIRLPKHKTNLDLGFSVSQKTYLSVNYALTGSRTDTDFTTFEVVDLPLFSLISLYCSKELLLEQMKVFFRADNLLNENYTEVFGYTTRGRNFSIGISLSL